MSSEAEPSAQPLSCFEAIMNGRSTAVLCQGGVLAFKLDNERVCVEYHGPRDVDCSGDVPVQEFRAAVMQVIGSS